MPEILNSTFSHEVQPEVGLSNEKSVFITINDKLNTKYRKAREDNGLLSV